jgi:hypothetical protein
MGGEPLAAGVVKVSDRPSERAEERVDAGR